MKKETIKQTHIIKKGNNMKNKKPIIALGALAVVGLVAGTIAYFTSEATFDNVFTTATYKTKSEEVFESPSNWAPGQTVPKTLETENQGTIPVAVRVTTSESWKDENNQTIPASTISAIEQALPNNPKKIAIINLANTSDWEYDSDTGAYYYKKALKAADTTGATPVYDKTNSFMSGVTLNADLPVTSNCTSTDSQDGTTHTKTCTSSITGIGKATYTLTLTVETVQYDQYKPVWFANDAPDYENAVVITNN